MFRRMALRIRLLTADKWEAIYIRAALRDETRRYCAKRRKR